MKIVCKNCGTEMGNYLVLEGEEFLQIGSVIARQLHGICAVCGTEVHWSVPDRTMERLLARIKDRGEVL